MLLPLLLLVDREHACRSVTRGSSGCVQGKIGIKAALDYLEVMKQHEKYQRDVWF